MKKSKAEGLVGRRIARGHYFDTFPLRRRLHVRMAGTNLRGRACLARGRSAVSVLASSFPFPSLPLLGSERKVKQKRPNNRSL